MSLTNVAEQMQRQYNNLKGPVNAKDCLEIVNNPSILASTELSKTHCK